MKNPAYVATEHTDGAVGEGSAPYICPISGIEMSGKFRFVFIWSCGCVLAERALKEVKQNICHMVSILNLNIEKLYICASSCLSNRISNSFEKQIVASVLEYCSGKSAYPKENTFLWCLQFSCHFKQVCINHSKQTFMLLTQ